MAPAGTLPSVLFIGHRGDAEALTSGAVRITAGPVWGQFSFW